MPKIKSTIAGAVLAGVTAAVNDPATSATMADRPAITKAVVDAVEPIVTNATNNEPWFQSRVMLGSVATIVSGSFAIAALLQSGSTDGTLYAPLILGIAGAGFAIYGRMVAQKPLGS